MSYDHRLFNSNFNDLVKRSLVENLKIATAAVDLFWNSNRDFLSEGEGELYARTLNFAVQKQFRSMVSGATGVVGLTERKLNTYGARAVCIETADYVLNVCRTRGPMQLPPSAKYKLEFASGNRSDYHQIELSLTDDNQLVSAFPKKYAILGYNFDRGDMQHAQILVPDHIFRSILYNEDILPLFHILPTFHFRAEEEAAVASLKEDLVVRLKSAK